MKIILRQEIQDIQVAVGELEGLAPTRASQSASAKQLLTQIYGSACEVLYNEYGKPYIRDFSGSCSISHSGNKIAVALSKQDSIGIDIQNHSPKIVQVLSKFISPLEQMYLDNDYLAKQALIIWTIKEATYKYVGIKGLSLKEDIHVPAFDARSDTGILKIETEQNFIIAHYNYTLEFALSLVF